MPGIGGVGIDFDIDSRAMAYPKYIDAGTLRDIVCSSPAGF